MQGRRTHEAHQDLPPGEPAQPPTTSSSSCGWCAEAASPRVMCRQAQAGTVKAGIGSRPRHNSRATSEDCVVYIKVLHARLQCFFFRRHYDYRLDPTRPARATLGMPLLDHIPCQPYQGCTPTSSPPRPMPRQRGWSLHHKCMADTREADSPMKGREVDKLKASASRNRLRSNGIQCDISPPLHAPGAVAACERRLALVGGGCIRERDSRGLPLL